MNRRSFLKTCVGGMIGAVAVPAAITNPRDAALSREVVLAAHPACITDEAQAEFMQGMRDQLEDMMAFGTAGVHVADGGRITRIDPATITFGGMPVRYREV